MYKYKNKITPNDKIYSNTIPKSTNQNIQITKVTSVSITHALLHATIYYKSTNNADYNSDFMKNIIAANEHICNSTCAKNN